jgi:signal transduction histidine kinase
VAVLGAVFAITLAYSLLGYAQGPAWLALIVAYFAAASQGHRWLAWASLVIGYPVFVWLVPLANMGPLPSLPVALGTAAWMAALGAVAELSRVRSQRAIEAARQRHEEDRRRASEERLRIARELHDVLAHNISLINVQAGAGLDLMEAQPEQARIALSAIREASKAALGELRSVLEIMRSPDEELARQPAPGLDRVEELAARDYGPDLSVCQETLGRRRPLPASVELAAYRIIQEAMTNVARHAGPAHATIRLVYQEQDLLIEVEDDGKRQGGQAGQGNGLPGMRERATALGGWFEAGPRPEGGFRVRAALPVLAAKAIGSGEVVGAES